MRRAVTLVCLTVCSLQPMAARQQQAALDLAKTRVVVRFPAMDRVSVQEKVVFKSVDGTDLAMDVYSIPGGQVKPAVVLVSGGTDVRGWGLYKDYGRIVGASEVVAVIPDKRYQGPKGLEEGAQDTLDLLAHLRTNAARYNIDANRICLWTFSAGGSLAQLGIDPKNKLSCVVSYYGLGQAGPHIALREHAATMPPMLVVRAGRDNPGLNNAIDTFAALALALNAPVTVMNYPAGVHGFEVEDTRPEPKEPANVAETERILRTTMHWIRERVNARH
jgi:dienelactone hydrolase